MQEPAARGEKVRRAGSNNSAFRPCLPACLPAYLRAISRLISEGCDDAGE